MENEVKKYVVEDGIPIPPRAVGKGNYGPVRQAMSQLEVGQSFAIEGDKEYERANGARTLEAKKTGKEFTVRQIDRAAGTYRVWRIK